MGRLTEYFGKGGGSTEGNVPSGGGNFIKVEVNRAQVEKQAKAIASLSVNNPAARKRIRAAIRKEIREAKKRISKDAKSALANDPRKAYLAVKFSMYKRILGGNISILSRRKAGAMYELKRPRKLDQNPKQRGGNRRKRKPDNDASRLETYYGADRGFILRFMNSGTVERNIKFGVNATRNGNRGFITQRRWFEISAEFQTQTAQENIAQMIEEELAAVYGEEMKE